MLYCLFWKRRGGETNQTLYDLETAQRLNAFKSKKDC